jgi:adenylosuccinate lyase
MGRMWTDEDKYRCWLQVESAASAVLAEFGVIPAAAAIAAKGHENEIPV